MLKLCYETTRSFITLRFISATVLKPCKETTRFFITLRFIQDDGFAVGGVRWCGLRPHQRL